MLSIINAVSEVENVDGKDSKIAIFLEIFQISHFKPTSDSAGG